MYDLSRIIMCLCERKKVLIFTDSKIDSNLVKKKNMLLKIRLRLPVKTIEYENSDITSSHDHIKITTKL